MESWYELTEKDEKGMIHLSVSYFSVRNGMQSLFWCLPYA